jgi:hypothetical protein
MLLLRYHNHTSITVNQNYELQVTQGTTVITKKFSAIVNPNGYEALPAGLVDGINYNTTDATKATSFRCAIKILSMVNNWQPSGMHEKRSCLKILARTYWFNNSCCIRISIGW